MARRILAGAEADHQAEQDHGDGGGGQGGGEGGVARRGVDHRMGPAAGVFVVAEVQQQVPGVALAPAPDPGDRRVGGDGDIRRPEDHLGLGAEGAAGKKPADGAAAAADRPGHGAGIEFAVEPPRPGVPVERRLRRRLQRRDDGRVRRRLERLDPDQAEGIGLAPGADPLEDLRRHRQGRRLGDDHHVPRSGVRLERVDRHQRRDAADPLVEIVAADADRLGNPLAAAGDEAGDFLHPRSRGADDRDLAARHPVGEGQRHAVHDRGAAVGSHHEKAERPGLALEAGLLRDRHVVAEDHHVQPLAQGLAGLGRRERAGHGDQREVGAGRRPHRHADAARPPGGAVDGGGRRRFEQARRRGERRLGGLRAGAAHRDDEVAAVRGLALGRQHAGVRQDPLVGRGAHHQSRLLDPVHRRERPGEAHQRHRIEVEAPAHPVDDGRAQDAPTCSASAFTAASKTASGARTTPAPTCPTPGSRWAMPVLMTGASPVSRTRRTSIPVGTPA